MTSGNAQAVSATIEEIEAQAASHEAMVSSFFTAAYQLGMEHGHSQERVHRFLTENGASDRFTAEDTDYSIYSPRGLAIVLAREAESQRRHANQLAEAARRAHQEGLISYEEYNRLARLIRPGTGSQGNAVPVTVSGSVTWAPRERISQEQAQSTVANVLREELGDTVRFELR